uniref:Uncharacterized protein isoform X1 n=1 Tax=Pogona vitticeps TaxID=103695 RepID=A0ABM5G4U0_9SAUR
MRICVQPAMVGLGYCPKGCSAAEEEEEACRVSCLDDTWCGPGERCCQEDCRVRCVAAEPARPGVCPRKRVQPASYPCANQCEDDRSCPPGMKCCFDGCGLGCMNPRTGETPACTEVAPTTPRKTCPDLCTDDANCPRNMKCSSTKCGFQCKVPHPGLLSTNTAAPQPRPEGARFISASVTTPFEGLIRGFLTSAPPQTERPGVCPSASQDTTDLCQDWCKNDSECPGAKKCCPVGCTRACREPSLVKPGACPLQLRGSMGPCPDVTLQNCSHDFDCEDAQKCCSVGCNTVCREPEAVRPGSCPLRVAESTAVECLSLTFCVKDDDCAQAHMKCCWLSCGWVCLPVAGVPMKEPFPVTGTPSPEPVQKETEELMEHRKAADATSRNSSAPSAEE